MSTPAPSPRTHAQQQEFALLVLIGTAVVLGALAVVVPWTLAATAAWLHRNPSGATAPSSRSSSPNPVRSE